MLKKVLITRKAVNVEELKSRTGLERDKVYFTVEKVVELPKDRYEFFINNLHRDFDFIEQNKKLMYVDEHRTWHCILVKADGGTDGILVEAEGYSYPRYTSYIENIEDVLK